MKNGKWEKGMDEQNCKAFRAAKKGLRDEYMAKTIMFMNPANDEPIEINAASLRKLYMKRLFKPKKGKGIFDPIKELI